jgi:hypothetical protein
MAYTEMSLGPYPSSFNKARWVGKILDRPQSSCPETSTSGAPGLLRAFKRVIGTARRSRPVVVLALAVITLGLSSSYGANAQIINYPSGFAGSTSSGSGGSGPIWLENASTLSGSAIQLTARTQGLANNVWYRTPVNVQAFSTTFTWTVTCPASPTLCGDGMGFMIISDPNSTAAGFTYSGAGGGQFSWSECTGTGNTRCPAINSILVKFDLFNGQTGSEGDLTGFYSGGEFPQAPNNPQYDMAPSGINMQSGHLMRATLSYNGTVLKETVTDSVTGATYTNSYTVNIPSLVAGNVAYVGFGAGTGAATATQNLQGWTYTVQSAGQASEPSFSPAGGTYSAAQSVKLSSASSGSVICYNTTGSPATNSSNGCASGTPYTSPITVSSNETLYAVAGGSGYGTSPVASASYVIQSSVQAAAPAFSPAGGTYSGSQSVALSSGSGTVICYNTTGGPATNGSNGCASGTLYTGPITVSSSETLYAVAGGSGYSSSSVASATYVIQAAGAAAASSSVIDYPGGFNSSAVSSSSGGSGPIWMENGSTLSGSQIQLAQMGSNHGANNAFYKTPVNVQAFTTTFNFQIQCGSVNDCVSGMGFIIICACTGGNPVYNPPGSPGFTYSGDSGNQFSWSQCPGIYSPETGFSYCLPLNSILVKFDTLNVVTGAFGSSLTGLCSGGIYCEPPQNVNYDMAPSGINLTSGHVFSATLAYNGSTLSESVTDTSTGAQYTNTYSGVNIPSLVAGNTAFVGFGSGTADTASQNAFLDSWTYTTK